MTEPTRTVFPVFSRNLCANAGLKVTALVGGMVARADSVYEMALLRHGGMKKLFTSGTVSSLNPLGAG